MTDLCSGEFFWEDSVYKNQDTAMFPVFIIMTNLKNLVPL